MILNIPLVSIIVPNYNHEKYLKHRLESIFNQTYSNFEVILLDDCSNDNSREILQEYAKNPKVSHCIFNETNCGNTFTQWEKGISLSNGEFIWIAESDDYCDWNFLETVSEPLIENKEVVLSFCQSNRVNEEGEITGSWKNHTDDLDSLLFEKDFIYSGNIFIEKFLIYKNVIPNASAVLFRKDKVIIKEHLNIDSYFKYCGDWIFYFKLLINRKVAFVSLAINNFRYHSNSVIANANDKIDYIEIINIDFRMRKKMMRYVSLHTVQNIKQIKINNRKRIKQLIYEQVLMNYHRGNKFNTLLLLGQNPDVFFKKFHFRKKTNYVLNFFYKILKKNS